MQAATILSGTISKRVGLLVAREIIIAVAIAQPRLDISTETWVILLKFFKYGDVDTCVCGRPSSEHTNRSTTAARPQQAPTSAQVIGIPSNPYRNLDIPLTHTYASPGASTASVNADRTKSGRKMQSRIHNKHGLPYPAESNTSGSKSKGKGKAKAVLSPEPEPAANHQLNILVLPIKVSGTNTMSWHS